MQWRNPTYLWLFVAWTALAVGLALALRRRAVAARAFAESGLMARLTPDVDRRRRQLRLGLRLLTLAILLIALAGPKWGFRWEQVEREGIDLIVAIDTSRSMLATDVKPNRLERAKLAVLDLTKLLAGDRVGLVPFAGTAFLECPLTLDHAAFERSLRALHVGIMPRGGTALERAIDTSLEGFEARQGKHEALILITDGEETEGGDFAAAAQRAADRGVKIYTVGIGTTEGELLPLGESTQGFVKDRQGQVVKSRLNEETLQKIAQTSGGAYVRGLGASLGLDEVFRDHIAKMERREVASTLERRYEERFQIPVLLALLLLVIETVVGERKTAGWEARLWPFRRRRSTAPAAAADSVAAGRRAFVARQEGGSDVLALAASLALAANLAGWLDPPGNRAAEGNRLYETGKYAEAAEKYGEGLVDAPESPLLQFNRSAALYKEGKYGDAIEALNKVLARGDKEWTARAAHNLGTAQYQLGANAAEKEPQAAIASWEQALTSFKRAIAADPIDEAPKFNHELVAHKLAELKKKLEEEKQKQEEQQQQQEQQQQEQQQEEGQDEQQQPPPEQEQGQEQQPQEQPSPQQQEQAEQPKPGEEQEQGGQEEAGEPEPQPQEQAAQPQGADGEQGSEAPPQDLDRQAAQAVIDIARDEELGPEDLERPQVGVAGIGEPTQDW